MEDKIEQYMFTASTPMYITLTLISFALAWWQYSIGNMLSAMFHAWCFGSVTTSWLFNRFQLRLIKFKKSYTQQGRTMIDPTMNREEINAVPEWKLAFELSEADNDNAPVGWSKYITQANHLIRKYYLEENKISYKLSGEKTVVFKMTSEHFSTLLTGNMVKVTNNSGDIPIEFFMDDIGIHMMEHIFLQKMSELRKKLADSNGIQITPVTEDSFK